MESNVQTLEQLMESSVDHSVHAGSFLRIEEDEQQCSGNVDLDEQILHKLSEQTHRIIELEERLFYYRTYCATLTKQLETLTEPQSSRGYQDTQQLQQLRVTLRVEREEKVQLQDKLAYLEQRNAGLEQKEKKLQSKMAQYNLKQSQWEQRKVQLERQNRKIREIQARMGEGERDIVQLKKKYGNVVRINRVLQQQLNQSDRKLIELESFMEIALADKCRHTMRMLHEQNQKQNQSVPNSQDSGALKPMRSIETKDSVFKEEYLHRARQRQQRLEQLRKGNHAQKDQRKKQQNRAQSHEPYRKFT